MTVPTYPWCHVGHRCSAVAGQVRGGLARALRRNGIPRDPDPSEPLPKRLLKNRLFWLTVVMIVVYLTLLLLLYVQVVPDREVPGGTLPGLGTEAIPIAIKYAAVTAIPLSLLFLWADRYRPQRFWVWFMTFGWGACVATFVSRRSTAGLLVTSASLATATLRLLPELPSTSPRSLKKRLRPQCCSG